MKKGSTLDNVVVWLGILLAIFISILWAIKNIEPYHVDLEKGSTDLEKIQGKMSAACSSFYYKTKYNPHSEKGNITINKSKICINNTIYLCRESICALNETIEFDLKNLTNIIIEKKNDTIVAYSE